MSNNPVKYTDPTGLAKCTAAQNFDKALNGLQTVLDYAGFIPALGNITDILSLGIAVFRGNVLDTVFSVIALLPAIGNAVSAPLKAIFNAVGNSTGITKAINTLGILFGGSGKIVSKLDGIGTGLKKFLNKIPSALASVKNNFVVKSIIGSKNLNNIIAGVKKGISNLVSRSNQVISDVKKDIKATSNRNKHWII